MHIYSHSQAYPLYELYRKFKIEQKIEFYTIAIDYAWKLNVYVTDKGCDTLGSCQLSKYIMIACEAWAGACIHRVTRRVLVILVKTCLCVSWNIVSNCHGVDSALDSVQRKSLLLKLNHQLIPENNPVRIRQSSF